MTAGNAQNLTREESAALVQKLGVRADWLITGEGAMLGNDESHDEFAERMHVVSRMHALIGALPLSELTRGRLCAVITGDPAQDGPEIAKAILNESSTATIDIGLVVRISAQVETALTNLRARISVDKKEELVRLFYDHFALKGRVEEETIERHLKLVVNQ